MNKEQTFIEEIRQITHEANIDHAEAIKKEVIVKIYLERHMPIIHRLIREAAKAGKTYINYECETVIDTEPGKRWWTFGITFNFPVYPPFEPLPCRAEIEAIVTQLRAEGFNADNVSLQKYHPSIMISWRQ